MREIFRLAKRFRPMRELLERFFVLMVKCAISLSIPLVYSAIVVEFWYRKLYLHGIHADEKAENIITTALIAISAIIFGLLSGKAFETTWDKFQRAKRSTAEGDIEAFMLEKHVHLSPLVHILIAVVSFILLASVMAIKFPDAKDGVWVIGAVSYLLGLFFLVVVEIDFPYSGLWFIRDVMPEWLEIDAKAYTRVLREVRLREWRRTIVGRLAKDELTACRIKILEEVSGK